MIGVVTDSGSQLDPGLAERLGITIVPLWVVVDGAPHREGIDLDADAFWARWVDGAPTVSTSQPSPGEIAATYRDLVGAGATRIVSVHTGSTYSGTVNSARLAAAEVPVPVEVVDTGTASFGVAVAAVEVAVALAEGASVATATAHAAELLGVLRNTFVVGALDLARAGGRVRVDAGEGAGQPVLELVGDELVVHATVTDAAAAVEAMAAAVLDGPGARHVAVGVADPAALPLGDLLADRLRPDRSVVDVVRYRVGPSVGAHSGPGTAGAFWWPASAA